MTLSSDRFPYDSFTAIDGHGRVSAPPGSVAIWAEDGRSRRVTAGPEPVEIRADDDMIILKMSEGVIVFLVFGRSRVLLAIRDRVARLRWHLRRFGA